ncbi:MAG: DUF523 domain-containing protein [Solobacterium sp.]|nr:DUF523 domain-containing protein [Solobacterium sp.]
MANIAVSACLLGFKCRYDGKSCYFERIEELKKNHTIIPVCPEQMGGLPTPRVPSEIVGDRVITKTGTDVTENYSRGRETALSAAVMNNVRYALFKQKSPSCGKGRIYDGTFTGRTIEGNGVTAELFLENGIRVFSEDEFDLFKECIDKSES